MSDIKHTAGPWKWKVSNNGNDLSVTSETGRSVVSGCGCCGSPWTDNQCAEANARLIASAPELLEALKEAIQFANSANNYIAGQDLPAANRWEAVVAKAEGRT